MTTIYERHRDTGRTAAGRVQVNARGVKFSRHAALTPHQQSEALNRLAAGDTQRTVAAMLGVSQATISRIANPAVQQTTGGLSQSTEAWSQAALDAGNKPITIQHMPTRSENACFKEDKEKAAGPMGPAAKGEPDKYKGGNTTRRISQR